jgi:tetratricopeptide (TPR) repeat protein
LGDEQRGSVALQGNFKDAEAWWQMAKDEAEAGFGPEDAHMAVIANGLADVYRKSGGERFKDAEKLYQESVDITRKHCGPLDVRYSQALQYLGQYYSDAGRYRDALDSLEAAAKVKGSTLGKHHVDYAQVRANRPSLMVPIINPARARIT